ncbi:hypothetical protein SAMN04488128_102775 [Chitinophaga eiseniae]|uniref:Uncharacterized protein n=1 Tax=Chitinophaga eiseniae TaxID=634771 RepID=A0A1T4R307_9BACT|nr:hypothetical protein SAMN04488128_102775 [Chitinophaga eiseniae]
MHVIHFLFMNFMIPMALQDASTQVNLSNDKF